jgi:hypothetical protein
MYGNGTDSKGCMLEPQVTSGITEAELNNREPHLLLFTHLEKGMISVPCLGAKAASG